MPDRLQEIRARLDAATPGPWVVKPPGEGKSSSGIRRGALDIAWSVTAREDADLIANAPADIAWLLAEVERLQRANDEPSLASNDHLCDVDEPVAQDVTKLECSNGSRCTCGECQ